MFAQFGYSQMEDRVWHAALSFKKQKGLNDAAGTTSASCMETCGAFLILKAARPGGAWGEAGREKEILGDSGGFW